MAIRKTVNLLPQQFQTDVNKKFLNATLDQLISPGTMEMLSGFVGRRDVDNFKNTDSYIVETDNDRLNYQLEPAVTIKKELSETKYDFASTYIDIVNSISAAGGDNNNHDKLFSNEYTVWSPPIDYDKTINYTKYYWLQTGPDRCDITDPITISDIVGKKTYTYTSVDGNKTLKFSTGLKVRFTGTVTPSTYANIDYIVADVGTSIRLIPLSELYTPESAVYTLSKDYLTIKRGAIDGNQWSNNNRWFHEEIIGVTATYNKDTAIYDSALRAKRPILEFDNDLKLYDYGTKLLTTVDLVDTTFTDAFTQLEGEPGGYIDGVALTAGQKVVFTADTDPLVNGYIYDVQFVTIGGVSVIHLEKNTTVADPATDNTIIVNSGADNKGTQWYYKNSKWYKGQVKTGLNQAPIFDVFDKNGNSFSTYASSTFAGSNIFSYAVNSAGTADTELGFALTYKNFTNIGDIIFNDNLIKDSFSYTSDATAGTTTSVRLATGFLHKNTALTTYSTLSNWEKAPFESRQFIQNTIVVGSELKQFKVTTIPKTETTAKNLIVTVNGKLKEKGTGTTTKDYYVTTDTGFQYVNFTNNLTIGDILVIKVHTDTSIEKLTTGEFYTIPTNLSNNPLNDMTTTTNFTLGQVRDHISSCIENSLDFSGATLGSNNIRDIGDIATLGTKIIQNTGSLLKAGYMLTNGTYNLIDSITHASNEYNRFKNQFLNKAKTIGDFTSTSDRLDKTLRAMAAEKNSTMPYFDSDMVAFSTDITTLSYTVFDIDNKQFELNTTYNDTIPGQTAVLVYKNDVMLLKDQDYTFSTTTPFVTLTSNITLAENDVIKLVEYTNTGGNFIPPTPTKLGLYPKYVPSKYSDDTYTTTIDVIQGHDGSITPAYSDYRDDLLLELERRIYNNIKAVYNFKLVDINSVIPSRFRKTQYSTDTVNNILAIELAQWANNNNVDYTKNSYYVSGSDWTYNYKNIKDTLSDAEFLPGYWRAIYKYFYDTDRPHTHPWEMLGFSIKPSWWETTYGPAPYTKDNLVLWTDIEAGKIVSGDRAGTYIEYARPGLVATFIPTDAAGDLKSPTSIGIVGLVTGEIQGNFSVGHQGPVETAWRRSSYYPFAIQILLALTKPAKYCEFMFDTSKITTNMLGHYVDKTTTLPIKPNVSKIHSYINTDSTVDYTLGYNNWVVDYSKYLGLNTTTFYKQLNALGINLAYKMSGFADKDKLKIILEQISPSKSTTDIFIPQEDYNFHLMESSPIQSINYSGVIITRSTGGWKIDGYNKKQPTFKILPSIITSNRRRTVSVGGYAPKCSELITGRSYSVNEYIKSGDIYYQVKTAFIAGDGDDLANLTRIAKLPTIGGVSATQYDDYSTTVATIPYGKEYTTVQEVYDFLISYGRYLESVGFVFDNVTNGFDYIEDWKNTAKEFLFWTLHNFSIGSMITCSAGANTIKLNLVSAQIDTMSNNMLPSSVIDQNRDRISVNNLFYSRIDNNFQLSVSDNTDGIYAATFNPIQTEHLLILENETVFKDVIWSLFTGSRQNRIKLVGYKTELWDGTQQLPGYVLLDDTVDDWDINKSYPIGEIVKFKDKFYASKFNHDPNDLTELGKFDFSKWKLLDRVNGGLLTNLDSKADNFRGYYEIEDDGRIIETDTLASNLIGFQNRKYLENLQIGDIAQKKFYQGFIKEKGTSSITNKLLRAKLPAIDSTLNLYEEWAFRVGEYGSVASSQVIEFKLKENEFTDNPELIEIINTAEQYKNTNITHRPSDLYQKPLEPRQFNKNVFKNLAEDISTRDYLPDAGYARLDDVQHKVLSLENWVPNNTVDITENINIDTQLIGKTSYTSTEGIITTLTNGMVVKFTGINTIPTSYKTGTWIVTGVDESIKLTEKSEYLNSLNVGDKMWVANSATYPPTYAENSNDWNVYRITSTKNNPISITGDTIANTIKVTFKNPVDSILVNEIIILRRFVDSTIPAIDWSGVYKVKTNFTSDGLNVLELYADLDLSASFETLSLNETSTRGEFLKLESARYATTSALVNRTEPTHGWEDGDYAWIDNHNSTNKWAVLEKKDPYTLGKELYPNGKATNTGFGQGVAGNKDLSTILVGSVYDTTSAGSIEQWTRDVATVFDVKSIFVSDITSKTAGTLNTSGYLLTVESDGLPHPAPFGTFPTTDGKNPNRVVTRNYKHTFKTRVGTNTTAAPQVAVPLGGIGIMANGVVIASPSATATLPNDNGPAKGVAPTGFEWNAVENATAVGMDASHGHPQEDNQYHYHSGKFLSQWDYHVYQANTYYQGTNYSGDHWRHTDGHSKILGYAYDGYPIYGPFGYQTATDSTTTPLRMTSAYQKHTDPVSGRGYTYTEYPAGTFINDYQFNSAVGTLDKHNGRYCVTPDYPDGTYAYFLTITSAGVPVYPYIIGPTFKEIPTLETDTVPVDPGGSNAQTIALTPGEFTYSNTVVDGSKLKNSGWAGWQFDMAVDDDYVVTSAPNSNSGQGYAIVLKKKTDKTYEPFDIMRSPSPTTNGYFGYDIAVSKSGTYVLVGAPGELKAYMYKLGTGVTASNEYFNGDGSTNVFTFSSTSFSNSNELTVIVDGQIKIETLDYTLSATQITFVAASIPPSGTNNIHVRKGNYYSAIKTFTGASGTDFGRSVALSDDGTIAFIGQPNKADGTALSAGATEVWSKTPTDTYFKIQDIKSNISSTNENFGKEVECGVDGHIVAIGSPGTDFLVIKEITTDAINAGQVECWIDNTKHTGTITGTVANPTVSIGDKLVINDQEVTFTGTALSNVVSDITAKAIPHITASATSDNKLKIVSTKTDANAKLTIRAGTTNGGTVFTALGLTLYTYKSALRHPDGPQNAFYGEHIKFNNTATMITIGSPSSSSEFELTLDGNLTKFDQQNTIITDVQPDSGSALIYDINTDLTYSLIQRVDWANRKKNDKFGTGLAMIGNTALIGAPGDDYFVEELKTADGVATAYAITGQFTTDNLEISMNGRTMLQAEFSSDNASPNSTVTFTTAPVATSAIVFKKYTQNTGSVLEATNTNNKVAWNSKRTQSDKIDIGAINKVITYDKSTNKFIDYIDYHDPIKGKIPGVADEEISFKTIYDPAVYNVTFNATVVNDLKNHWGPNEVGVLWWDLTNTKYIEYEQGELEYKRLNWGKLFPGTQINIYEWIESDSLPSTYVSLGGDGTPKFADDSAYVEYQKYNTSTNTLEPIYYYWVKNKTSVPEVSNAYLDANGQIKFAAHGKELELKSFIPAATRKLPAKTVATILTNPTAYGLKYIGIAAQNAFIGYNLQTGLTGENIILSIEYDTVKNDIPLHTEWQLVQKNNPLSKPNNYLITKLGDSLAGKDVSENLVPDTNVHVGSRYGIMEYPRQSMFIDRLGAIKVLVNFCNSVFTKHRMALDYSLIKISSADKAPTYGYGETVATYTELTYINTNTITDGYKVIVASDETRGNYWVTYQWSVSDNRWNLEKKQKYDTTKYWDYIDWYATGYDSNTIIDYTVATENDRAKLDTKLNDVVKVLNDGQSKWILYKNTSASTTDVYDIIGQENATIKFKTTLYTTTTPLAELRYIIDALNTQLFVSDLEVEFNKLWFELIHFILYDQNLQVDWAFKTSFVTINQTVRKLSELVNYSYDVQDSVRDFINEAKPYRTNIREYVYRYDYTELPQIGNTDFDLPGYYDTTDKLFRSPNVYEADDDARMLTAPWVDWKNHYTKKVVSVNVLTAGSGYATTATSTYDAVGYDITGYDHSATTASPPIVTISSGAQWKLGYTYDETKIPGAAGAQAVLVVPEHSPDTLWYYSGTEQGTTQWKDMGWKVTIKPKLATNESKTFAVTVVLDGTGKPDFYIDGTERPNLILYRGSTYTFTQTDVSNLGYGFFRFSAIEDGTHRDGSGATAVPVMKTPGLASVDSITVTNGGTGYVTTPIVTISGGSGSGATGYANLENYKVRDLKETIKFDRVDAPSHVKTIAVTAGGSGYTSAPTVTITNASGDTTGVGASAKAVITGGAVTAVIVEQEGTGYTAAPTISFTGGGGSSATATATVSYSSYNKLETAHEAAAKKHSDRLTLYYAGGQAGTGSTKTWDNKTADILTYDAVIADSGLQYKANKVTGATFDMEPGYDRASFSSSAFDDSEISPEGIAVISSVDTDLGGGDFSTTGGIDPADVVVDGDGFVTEYTSHAPEEQVPGRVFDTLDIKVYEMPSPRESGVTIKKHTFEGNGSTVTYDFTGKGGLPTNLEGIEVYVNNSLKKLTTDYTVSIRSNDITMVTPVPAGQLIHFVLVETGGDTVTSTKQDFYGDGSTTQYVVNVQYEYAQYLYVTVNGVENNPTWTATSYYKKTKLTFASAPPSGGRIRVHTFNKSGLTLTNAGSGYTSAPAVTFSGGGGSAAAATAVINAEGKVSGLIVTNAGTGYTSAPTVTIAGTATATATVTDGKIEAIRPFVKVESEEQTITVPGSPTWPASYTYTYGQDNFFDFGPDAAKVFVYLNNERLNPPDTEYYTGDGSTAVYACPSNPTIAYASVTDAMVQVHVDGVLKTLTTDYTFTGGTPPRDEITFAVGKVPAAGAEIAITVRNGQYWIPNDYQIILENGSGVSVTAGTIATGDKLFIQSFANQRYSKGKTIVIKGTSVATATSLEKYDAVIYDSSGYAGDVSVSISTPIYDISALENNSNYVWVWLNGVPQIANHDYYITGTKLVMTPLSGSILASDMITVSGMRQAEQRPGIAFRIWKDMFDKTSYYRIASANTTTLSTALAMTDIEINVTDATKLLTPVPTTATPGVIFINGERIEYWEIDGNKLKRIRRGTWGTGAHATHASASEVVDGSKQQLIPGSTVHTKVWYDQGTTPAAATNGLGLGMATGKEVTFLKEAPLSTPKVI